MRAQAGRQHRRYRQRPWVPDRKPVTIRHFQSSKPTTTPVGKCTQDIRYQSEAGTVTIAKGSYIHAAVQTKQMGKEGDGYTTKVTLEEPWSPAEFIHEASKIELPWRQQPAIPDRTLKVIIQYVTKGSKVMEEESTRHLKTLRQRKQQLECAETKARAHLDAECHGVNKSKPTVLMAEMLNNIWYPDAKVADELRAGFQMVGEIPDSGVFETKPDEEIAIGADPQWLGRMADDLRGELKSVHSQEKQDDFSREVYRITCQGPDSETQKG